MSKFYLLLCALVLLSQPVLAEDNPIVDIQTNHGTITVQLAPDKSPLTVANFLSYVNEGFYENTIFHRIIPGFMIQGGGYNAALIQKPTHAPIKLEADNGLSNLRGTIAMARTSMADSATAQFFINTVNNNFPTPGYAVFGKVIEGLNIVDVISKVSTNKADTPLQSVTIEAARVREAQLSFKDLKPLYQAGESLTIALQENTVTRQRALDLWVAVKLPNGEFRFISPENTESFSAEAKPFMRKVGVNQMQHSIITLTIPVGLAGQYSVYAIFNEPERDVTDLTHSLRSNLANVALELR
ncbi:MAG: hypothetical protein HOP02_14930 [Methylococcaceae bacterium]|nr:hypothetical protein [Methylococcaceae bacterium]